MPDILIRMNMPNSCVECSSTGLPVAVSILGASCPWCRELIDPKVNLRIARHEDCPLHELPEHGDLIDRGKIVAHYRKCECNLGSDRHLEFLTVHDWIEEGIVYDLLNAPVIVPASKEETE